MTFEAAVTIAVTVLLAAVGYAAKYINDVRVAQRKDRLDRVNRQLSELYGPLIALSSASNRLWDEFRARYRPDTYGFWSADDPPTDEEARAWRDWMTTIFMPLNQRMMEAVLSHADLIRGRGVIPDPLANLCAHAAGYDVILAHWESGEFEPLNPDDNLSVIAFPREQLRNYLTEAYVGLKDEQEQLLQSLASRGSPSRRCGPGSR